MKQTTFDNIVKVLLLIMLGYFIYKTTDKKGEGAELGRYRYLDKGNGYIIDSKTGYLYDSDDRIKR